MIQEYNLNMIPSGTPLIVYLSQYDKTIRELQFNLYNDWQPYIIPEGAVVTLQGTKPDGTGFMYKCSIEGYSVKVATQEQMTVLAGHIPCEIRVTNNDGVIGSANFYLLVEKSALDDDTAISETDIPIFEELVQEAKESASEAKESAQSIQSIVPSTSGTIGQVLTKTEDGADWTTINSAEWGNITGTLANQTDLNNALNSIHQIPNGGTIGQVLGKNSNTDYDVEWIDQSSGSSLNVQSFQANPTADTTVYSNGYSQTVSVEGITDLTPAWLMLGNSSAYEGNTTVITSANSVKIHFSVNPTANETMYIVYGM